VRIVVLAVGRIKERGLRDAADEYVRRIRRHVPLEEIELKDGPPGAVAAALVRRIPDGAHVTLLEVGGARPTSEGFAQSIERQGRKNKGVLVFVVGGADGIPPELARTEKETLSLSSLTLPHRLARLFLLEQLYRAMTILRGEPYAR
jgi:23S rRNA (pseudouridine1915-N3)-methyltransferase